MTDLLKLKRELEAISKILSQSLDNINFEIENSHPMFARGSSLKIL